MSSGCSLLAEKTKSNAFPFSSVKTHRTKIFIFNPFVILFSEEMNSVEMFTQNMKSLFNILFLAF